MLCTSDKTYAIRSVVLSNSVLVTTPGLDKDGKVTVEIRDQLNEVLELVPSVPRLHKLDSLLKRRVYDEKDEEDEEDAETSGYDNNNGQVRGA